MVQGIGFLQPANFGNSRGVRVELIRHLVLLRESRRGQDISQVRSRILWKKWIHVMIRKTSSLMANSLCDQAKMEIATSAGWYYDSLSQLKHTITNTKGAIVKQLAVRAGISNNIRHVFSEGRKEFGGSLLRLIDLKRMLRIAIASLPWVFGCVDPHAKCLPKWVPELRGFPWFCRTRCARLTLRFVWS